MSNQRQREKRILRVQFRDPVIATSLDGVRFSSVTSAYHEAPDDGRGGRERGVGKATSITLDGQFITLQLPRCRDVTVPLTQVAYMELA